ncbi:anthranilate synthase component I family protein [Microbacterium fluvii]|uniref:Anthranilate synthase component I family protein n=1 Tax=Microbacterium fluvii TaxID=415215 RepID=A0ABW2HAA2_9MICO|nr:anthranilate synthase component I family protein [Microbacterium fluvii]MCU4671891.1 anthranilate synthase component I family protein [Microbacterium fluvii]
MPRSRVVVPLEHVVDASAAYAVFAAAATESFWLDAGPDAAEGWSFVGSGAAEPDADAVRAVVLALAASDAPALPEWVGWVGYEAGVARAGAPTASSGDDAPAELWLRVERMLALDHATGTAWLVADPAEIAVLRSALVEAAPVEAAPAPSLGVATGRHEPAAYAALIEQCRAAIREGDAYQLCLTTRFELAASVDPFATFLRLRAATPSHHGGLIVSGGAALISASPEQFLDVAGGRVSTRPIKGTRPRGADAAADAALADELLASVKERAENVMIVDLMRNDLSRVCAPGSVGVDALLAVESYPAVHQLVSTVSGELLPEATVGDLLDAAFPAGSMTGAPKLSAMTILHRLEGGPRGVYAGCFGWVGTGGRADLAMVIRSIVATPDLTWVGAGGGITWLSDAAAEVAEVGLKARAPLAALGALPPPGWTEAVR